MMRLPRLASPRELLADFKAMTPERRPYRWVALLMAIAIPAAIFLTFVADFDNAERIRPQVVYVNSWSANRSADETKANIDAQEARRRAFEDERQKSFQKLQDLNNKIGL